MVKNYKLLSCENKEIFSPNESTAVNVSLLIVLNESQSPLIKAINNTNALTF